jgi:hypothetical protein
MMSAGLRPASPPVDADGVTASQRQPVSGPARLARHLVFLPGRGRRPSLFLWPGRDGGEAHVAIDSPDVQPGDVVSTLAKHGDGGTASVVTERFAVERVAGTRIALPDAIPLLADLPADSLQRVPTSIAAWSFATKLALDLIARERLTPVVRVGAAGAEAHWGVSLALPEDADRFMRLARAFPLSAHAIPTDGGDEQARGRPPRDDGPRIWTAEDALLEFLDSVADLLAAGSAPPREAPPAPERWERKLVRALTEPTDERVFLPATILERGLIDQLTQWAAPPRGSLGSRAPRLCLKLDPPPASESADNPTRHRRRRQPPPREHWRLSYYLQAATDPSLLLPARDVWAPRRHDPLAHAFPEPQETLLRELARAGRAFPPIAQSLEKARPEGVTLDTPVAWLFLAEAAPFLTEAGFGVILPAALTPNGQRRLRVRMRVGESARGDAAKATSVATHGLALDGLLDYRWQAAIGDEPLEREEFEKLVALKRPLVRWRGEWVVIDPSEAAEVRRLLVQRGGRLATREALAMALGETLPREGHRPPVDVVAEGALGALVQRLREGVSPIPVPDDLRGELRGYQERGFRWLGTMAEIGLGGCLADDMGLGKTIQTITYLLARRRLHPDDTRPALVVCPMSVVGNWERELTRFAPTLPVVRHHGGTRARTADALKKAAPHSVVVTTYALLRRDRALLAEADWAVAVLDEAQNVKNASSQQAQAARALRASHRFALTGTPVENRLAELWSILEFCVPGYLGPAQEFRRRYAVPIERYRDEAAAELLKRIVRPFVLRRLKQDVAADLPPKQEMSVVCTLTREQATLYQAAVEETMAKIEAAQGIERRGHVLALLTALKQICNHPAQYLHEKGPLPGRSGKLARVTEMLEETLDAGDRALVFTQFRQMGDRLVEHLEKTLGSEVLFLHGEVPLEQRDAMVRRFQEDPAAPGIFVLSLRAGGTGLNLTRATRVLHFDRWWNPAVEDQATDRAHRIGQERMVQVYRLVAAGTIEEKIDKMLEDKRALADRIVGAGETWITELGDTELRALVTLGGDATIEEEVD